MLVWIIYVALLINENIGGVRIGRISNATLTGPRSIMNGTFHECICQMIAPTNNIQSLNCFPLNHTCELFTTYLSTFVYEIKSSTNSLFYYQQWPSMITQNHSLYLDPGPPSNSSEEVPTPAITDTNLLSPSPPTIQNETI